jgi:plasmid stability protein
MTLTVKLDSQLEERLRQRAAATGRSASEVVRAALQAYLSQADGSPPRSAFELGADIFGRHHGARDLAGQRRRALAEVWAERDAARRGERRR